ncbi:MAG: SGNH/GDSL hydrolase family protein [Candidatus Latescibacterota bacterium]
MNAKRDYRADPFRIFVALGESITAGGWFTDPGRCWVSRLADLINDFQSDPVQCFNMGIGANVISTKSPCYGDSGKPAADERLYQHVIEKRPDLLVISYGLNDARGGTPLGFFREELVRIVRRVREAIDPLIVLPGPYYMHDFGLEAPTWGHGDMDLFAEFNQGIAEVGAEEDCLFVDLLEAYGRANWMVHYDGVHANDLGHRIVANRIFEKLAQNCSALGKKTQAAERTSPRWRDESCLKMGYE